MKPLIGVVADIHPGNKHVAHIHAGNKHVAHIHAGNKHVAHAVQQKYLDAVTGGAGGIALILPAQIDTPGGAWSDEADLVQLLGVLDGLFLTGATSNVAPRHYGAALLHPDSPADPARDHVTLPLVRAAMRHGLPILGVCRGCQEINVALGGTLHQAVYALPGMLDHRERPDVSLSDQYAPSHDVTFAEGGLLHTISGRDGARVNSLHHQGVDLLAPGLAIEATAADGLVEAFRLDDHDRFVAGVQWHPEWAFRDDPLSVAIFRVFGQAVRAHQTARTAQSARRAA